MDAGGTTSHRRRRLGGVQTDGFSAQEEVDPVSGTRITDHQVRLCRNSRKTKSQELAAAKDGISERSARRIDKAAALPRHNRRRHWRSGVEPFVDIWDAELVRLLRSAPKLKAITLLRKLQADHPCRFGDGLLRALQRHVRRWRALEGPPKEVFFPQIDAPGHCGLSDFTAMGTLRATIAGVAFVQILYPFVLAFARWQHAEVVELAP